MKKKFKTIRVLGNKFSAEVLTASPGELELNNIPAIQLLHERVMARRRREMTDASSEMFKITCLDDIPIDEDVPQDELEAEKIVSHERVVITDKNFNVIHGHESVLKADEEGASLIVLRIKQVLDPKDVFLLQVRHAAKEGMLFPAIRMEAIRVLHDEHSLEVRKIQLLLVGPKGKKQSPKEVTSELRVGQLFEKYPGYRIPFTGYELDKHSFSNLKYLVGNNSVFEEMSKSGDKEQHFLRMAINATKTRSKRLNTVVPPLMKHEDTRQLLFDQGVTPAEDLLKAKYPEDNFEYHPHNDLVAANEKLKRTDTLVLIKKQLDQNPEIHPLFRQILEITSTVAELSKPARKGILRALMNQDPEEFADVLAESHPELAVKGLVKTRSRITAALREVQ